MLMGGLDRGAISSPAGGVFDIQRPTSKRHPSGSNVLLLDGHIDAMDFAAICKRLNYERLPLDTLDNVDVLSRRGRCVGEE